MTLKNASLLLVSFSTLALAACQTSPKMEDAQYWQRKNATSALYLRGPKAQQTLHEDLATCVNTISEMERIAPVREAIPADTHNGKVPDGSTADGRLKKWDSPKRDGYLYAEHEDFVDFEGCMEYKGWERVEALPASLAQKSREDYLETVYGAKFQSQYNVNQQSQEQPANAYNSSEDMSVNN